MLELCILSTGSYSLSTAQQTQIYQDAGGVFVERLEMYMVETVESIEGWTTLKAEAERRGVSREAVYYKALRQGTPIKKLGRTLLIRQGASIDSRNEEQASGVRADS